MCYYRKQYFLLRIFYIKNYSTFASIFGVFNEIDLYFVSEWQEGMMINWVRSLLHDRWLVLLWYVELWHFKCFKKHVRLQLMALVNMCFLWKIAMYESLPWWSKDSLSADLEWSSGLCRLAYHKQDLWLFVLLFTSLVWNVYKWRPCWGFNKHQTLAEYNVAKWCQRAVFFNVISPLKTLQFLK